MRMTNGFEQLVWALGHSLWEGLVIAAGLWMVLRLMPTGWTRGRYGAALGAMGLVVFGVFVTWGMSGRGSVVERLWRGERVMEARQGGEIPAPAVLAQTHTQRDKEPAGHSTLGSSDSEGIVWGIGVLWMIGAAGMLVRMGVGLARAQRLAETGRAVELPLLGELARQMGVRRVRLVASVAYRVPMVVGGWWPVVLVPAALLAEMPPEQLRMILAHELAHVRRWDFLVNVVQGVIEALLFFNPAVWWISRQVRTEREACCDAAAARAVGDAAGMARTLAAVAERMGSGAWAPLGALAVSGNHRGGVMERVRRLMMPERRGGVRLPMGMFAAGLGAAAAVLVVLGGTAQLSVMAAEKLMTPRERVEKMEALQKEVGADVGMQNGTMEKSLPEGMVTGVIQTEDGQPLTYGFYGSAESSYQSGSSNYFGGYSFDVDKEGRFSRKVKGNRASVWVQTKGHAAAFSELLKAGADGNFPPVKLVLRKGYEGIGVVTDATGKPIAGAKVMIQQFLGLSDARATVDSKEYLSDEAGKIAVPHMTERPIEATVEAAGYQFDQFTLRFEEGKTAETKLAAARMTEGVVMDAETKRPIEGATIQMLQRKGFADNMWWPYERYEGSRPPVVATTDGSGRFSLDELRDDSAYVYWAAARGHASSIVRGVRAGERGLVWALGAARPIVVTVKADAGKMPRNLLVDGTIELEQTSQGYNRRIPVMGNGEEGTATIDDLLPGSAYVGAAGKTIPINESRETPLVLDLRKEAQPAQAMREVVVKLKWLADGAAPVGKLRVNYLKPEQPHVYTPGEVEVKDGEARIEVPAPTKFGYAQGTVVGYWVKERSEIEVPTGEGPYEVTAELQPAGAIHGQITDTDGQVFAQSFAVSLQTVKRAADLQNGGATLQPYNSNDGTGKYLLSPVPLGGVYRLVAWKDARFAVSEDLVVDEKHPIREVNLRFAEGVTLAGTVRGPDGHVAPGAAIEFDFSTKDGGGSFEVNARTDGEGRFRLEHVDAAAGDYSINVKPGAGGLNTRGKLVKHVVVSAAPVEISLEAGLTAKGRLVNVADGKGIPNVQVRLYAKRYGTAQYPSDIEARTDGDGVFEARGLEPIEYAIGSSDTYPADAKVNRDAAGRATGVSYSDTGVAVTGGEAGVKEIQRMLSPWR